MPPARLNAADPALRCRRRRSRGATARSARGSSPSARRGARASPPGTTRRSRPSATRDARLLIVGLAPGLRGANRTGRPFTGDYAGDLLYATLHRIRLRHRRLRRAPRRRADARRRRDHQRGALRAAARTSRRRREISTCRQFLSATIAAMPRLTAIVALGRIAHDSDRCARLGCAPRRLPLRPWRRAIAIDAARRCLFDSYHCSRYNTNTGVLTEAMFRNVFKSVRAFLD